MFALAAFYVSVTVKPHFANSINPPQLLSPTTLLEASFGVRHPSAWNHLLSVLARFASHPMLRSLVGDLESSCERPI